MRRVLTNLGICLSLFCHLPVNATEATNPTESNYYQLQTFPIPEGIILEVGAIEPLPDGTFAVSTRRGDIYRVENLLTDDPKKVQFHLFARGLHEVLGLAYRDGWLYATQRGEVTRLKDVDDDGRADLFETVADGWEINGDYHEYAFGSKFDKDDNLWVVLCLTGSFNSHVPFRGWCLRVTPDGEVLPTCSGLRSPGGIGFNHKGDVFYTDNQGPWNGTCSLKHLKPGSFQGHPAGNRWYELTSEIGKRPKDPVSGSRMVTEADKIPEYMPPSVLFPYGKMGKSASGIACDQSAGKFGPFENQLFVADQSASTVMRVYLEEVGGRYQGVCFPFREGFASGALALNFANDGSLLVGGTNRGWGSVGRKPFSLERLVWTGKIPFEMKTMSARPDGFELEFTKPVDRESAADPKSYRLSTYTYIFQESYGSPEVDQTEPTITKVSVSDDGMSVRLYIDKLALGHVHELHAENVRSTEGLPLLHPQAYYTLNRIPK